MFLDIANFFAHAWLQYGSFIITCCIWGVIGFGILAPAYLIEALYQSHRTGNMYHFGEGLHLRRRYYERAIALYGSICALALLVLFCVLYTRL